MKNPAPLDDTTVLFAHLPADGSAIGNGSLREMLGWNETRYFAARQRLIDDGRVLTGKGRGGSVRRASPAQGT
jgi:type I restriction enzyme M protein